MRISARQAVTDRLGRQPASRLGNQNGIARSERAVAHGAARFRDHVLDVKHVVAQGIRALRNDGLAAQHVLNMEEIVRTPKW
jgi:hypothetical protein